VRAPAEESSLVLPEFGPTLPALLRARAGRRAPVALAAGLLVAVLALAAAVLLRGGAAEATLVHRAAPAFSLLYAPDALRPAAPRPGELARLEGRGPAVRTAVTVRPLDVADLAALPIEATRYADRLRAGLEDFALRAEGRARVNDAPGYQLRFRAGPRGASTFGHDVLLVPDDTGRGAGLLLSLRQTHRARELASADHAAIGAAKRAFRSLRFGTERP